MKKIKRLFENINTSTLPEVIYKEICKYGDRRSFTSFTDDKGERVTEYGDLMPPYYMYYIYGDYRFYCIEKLYESFIYTLEKGCIFDKELNQLDEKSITPFFKEYGRGFQSGYYEFEDTIIDNTSLFNIDNKNIAHKIFSRVNFKFKPKYGGFTFCMMSDIKKTELLKKTYKIEHPFTITKEYFYKNGKEGGEFYKAWELILNNPTIFLPIFNEYIPKVQTDSVNRIHTRKKGIKPINNPHPRIFKDYYAFNLFESLQNIVVNNLADYSFIYRRMSIDKLIFESIGDSEFRQWLSLNYQIEIDKTKQLHVCTTPQKEKSYSIIKDNFK